MGNDSAILTPDIIQSRRRQAQTEGIQTKEDDYVAVSHSATVKVDYESEGRLKQPNYIYFNDYSIEDISSITIAREEDLLDNLVAALNKMKTSDCEFPIEDLSSENLLDTLIALKQQFVGDEHIHHWVCECQHQRESSEQIVNEKILKLSEFNYRGISEADEKMREAFRERFDDMTDEQWKEYLLGRYKDNPVDLSTYTKEEELKTIKINDTINIHHDGHVYTFRTYNVTRDLLKAKKYALDKWNPKIKAIQNRREANVPLAELKDRKEQEIEKLRIEQAQAILLYNKALMLEKFDHHAIPDIEKLGLYRKLPRFIQNQLEDILDNIEYGLYDEVEFDCPLCGTSNKRLLQHEINPIEFLPYRDSNRVKNVSTTGNNRKSAGFNIYIGL